MPHTPSTYKDGFKNIPFCSVCGVEYPEGECFGTFPVPETKIVGKQDTEKNELTHETNMHK